MGGNSSCDGDSLQKNLKAGEFTLDIEETIKDIPVISSLKKPEQKKLAKSLEKRTYKPGDFVMKEGEIGTEFFLIVSGQCQVTSKENGVLAKLEAGDYMGEQALLKETKRNASIHAVTDITVLVLNKAGFDKMLGKKTKVKFAQRENKRRAVLTAFKNEEGDDTEEDKSNRLKGSSDITADEREWLLKKVKDNLMFMNLSRNQKLVVINKMYLESVKKGTELIVQGDRNASKFYVIQEGVFEIIVDGTKVTDFKTGACFGELALMYQAPRAATVKASEDSKVWVVKRNAFRSALKAAETARVNRNITFLKTINEFKSLLHNELQLLDQAFTKVIHGRGATIIKEGDKGDKFYVIRSGTAQWSKKDGEKGKLKKGSYFGERALLSDEPRAATITAETELLTLELSRQDFTDLLGPLESIMKDRMSDQDEASQKYRKSLLDSKGSGKPGGGKRESVTDTRDNTICALNEFKTIGILGKGAFGVVSLVVDTKTDKSYALKAIKKFQIVELGQQEHIVNEKDVMLLMNNPFLVNLRSTYKDKYRVYFLLDVCLGGELFGILRKARCFNEDTSRFFSACVIEAFAYMHGKNIIYRDLKPENLVLDNNGYLKVTDFGFAKKISGKTYTLCGTPDYLAPEIVTGQGHGKGVDWWTLGILIYEMLASFPPFYDDEALQTYRKIVKGRVKFPRFFSPQARDIIKAFLKNKPTKRLGITKQGNIDLIRDHEWFTKFDWAGLRAFRLKAPISPRVRGPDDISNFDEIPPEDDDLKPVKAKDDFDETF